MMFEQFETEKKLMELYNAAPDDEKENMVASLISFMLSRAEADNHVMKLKKEAMTQKPCEENFYKQVMPLWVVVALGLK